MGRMVGTAGATVGPATRCAFAKNGVKRTTRTKGSDLRMVLPRILADCPYTILDARPLHNVTGVCRHWPRGRLRFPRNWGCAITEKP